MKNVFLKRFGEFGLIAALKRGLKSDRSVVCGIGDDTAVLRTPKGKELLFTTDMLIEDRHFRLKEASAREIGHKALAVNLSDIAAMGGVPRQAVVALGLPPRLGADFVKELYRGMESLARKFGVRLVGGDTNASKKLILSVALLGEVRPGKAILRSGAKEGDLLFVTGALGNSYASGKHLRFVPRIREAQFLARHFRVHAMMDLSDGLSSDLRRLCEASRVGAFISSSAIPVSPGARLEQALNEGEDFELLFALPPKEAVKLTHFHLIGRVMPWRDGVRLVRPDGRAQRLPEKGFDHFK